MTAAKHTLPSDHPNALAQKLVPGTTVKTPIKSIDETGAPVKSRLSDHGSVAVNLPNSGRTGIGHS